MMMFKYELRLTCSNCGFKNKLNVKKGITIKDYLKSEDCKCKNCGCLVNAKEYFTPYLKEESDGKKE